MWKREKVESLQSDEFLDVGGELADKGLGIGCYPCFHPGPFFEYY